MEKLRSQVNVTFCQIYLQTYHPPPPQGMEKLRSQVNVTFCQIYLQTYPPPPQGMEKLRSQVNVTFCRIYLQTYPPTRNNKVEISGQHDILVLMISRLVNGLEHHPPPLSSQKNEMLGFFGLRSTSDDRPGWSMDSNTICHPSPAKKSEMLIFSTAVCSRQQCLTNHYP